MHTTEYDLLPLKEPIRDSSETPSPCPLRRTCVGGRVLLERNTRRSSLPRHHCPQLSASCRRRQDALSLWQRREKVRRRKMVRLREYQRLRTMVPSIAAKPLVSKVTVIEEAIRYIDYLHGALLTKLRTKGLPSCLQGVNVDVNQLGHDDIKDLVCQLVESNQTPAPTPLPRRESSQIAPRRTLERSRQVPSYLTARPMRKKRT